jgi:hypothetical protein
MCGSLGTGQRRLCGSQAVVGATRVRRFPRGEKTVKHHLTNIFNKVGVSNRRELALFAVHHHLDSFDPVATFVACRRHPDFCGCLGRRLASLNV